MHADNIEAAERVVAWRQENNKKSVKGDDRSPAWTWIAGVYIVDGHVSLPSDNIMTMLREGGSMVVVKGSKTFKSQTQSGILTTALGWPIEVVGNKIAECDVMALWGNEDFEEHVAAVRKLGFDLLVKRAKIVAAKHIRVRALFIPWSCTGELLVLDDQITTTVLQDILAQAGQFKGLCDWRPSSRTPGQFGTFEAAVKELK
jgi:hypothetical protein